MEQIQSSLERLYVSVGFGAPQCSPGGAGGGVQDKIWKSGDEWMDGCLLGVMLVSSTSFFDFSLPQRISCFHLTVFFIFFIPTDYISSFTTFRRLPLLDIPFFLQEPPLCVQITSIEPHLLYLRDVQHWLVLMFKPPPALLPISWPALPSPR